jgi:LmbE family N-acetylglucosaminyl deacetylase
MKKKVIVFSPHPDDETFACGGTIAKKISEGCPVLVVTLTDGRHAFTKVFGIDSDPSPEELVQIRKEEVIRAAKTLGVPLENMLFLDFVDGKLAECEKALEEKIIEILENNPPSEIYFPSEKDAHPDHRTANRVIKDAFNKLGLSIPKYKYSIARPYARIGLVIDFLSNLISHRVVTVDVRQYLHLKEQAISEFKSEIGIISDKQEKPLIESVKKHLKREETFYIDK